MMKSFSPFLVILVALLVIAAPGSVGAASGSLRKLQTEVESFGENPEPVLGRYPLKICQGDCDKDSHCGDGLVCMLSRTANEAVPGCSGGESDPTTTHYCIADTTGSRDVDSGAAVVSVEVKPNDAAMEQTAEESDAAPAPDGATAEQEEQESSSAVSTSSVVFGVAMAFLGLLC